MPVITFEAAPMSAEQKREVARGFTDVAAAATGLPESAFYVFIKENGLENIAVGGTLLSDGHPASGSASEE